MSSNHTSPTPPKSAYTFPPDLLKYNVSITEYIDSQPGLSALIVGTVVFHPESSDRLLLIQRAASDFMPNLWETPGGMAEADRDRTVLDAAVRELHEESGLETAHVRRLIDLYEFKASDGRMFHKLTFEVEVRGDGGNRGQEGSAACCPRVKLDPEEHQDFVWVTEQEYRAGWAGERRLAITHPNQELTLDRAFKARRDEQKPIN
ncbi:hypothetical protein MGG_00836 [Pyricularia oryzae 70-15]|uniref:Nudix hydrolase domain-containing protein n=3 Tax=Pyricularia oryzae TaxID=318829 RepID=G4NE26_PYRO7|nr:uncharacterized protein MGG_00836 [Pyricularia oryzae 70-15]EHA48561.1 hypothetical protein MGG_00836 [Pyricularia oryzae 70-15]ELQ43804.1 NUDIX domain-containing protein [Pyricularia oryzae Y34]KAI7912602.1 hypothetical protein M9X92_009917 [Pyricularia oryzae]KAI7920764.1 hypothetical protein M0657_006457 [Pyricularia oryzae]